MLGVAVSRCLHQAWAVAVMQPAPPALSTMVVPIVLATERGNKQQQKTLYKTLPPQIFICLPVVYIAIRIFILLIHLNFVPRFFTILHIIKFHVKFCVYDDSQVALPPNDSSTATRNQHEGWNCLPRSILSKMTDCMSKIMGNTQGRPYQQPTCSSASADLDVLPQLLSISHLGDLIEVLGVGYAQDTHAGLMTVLSEVALKGPPSPVGYASADLTLELLVQAMQLVQPVGDGLAVPAQRKLERVVDEVIFLIAITSSSFLQRMEAPLDSATTTTIMRQRVPAQVLVG